MTDNILQADIQRQIKDIIADSKAKSEAHAHERDTVKSETQTAEQTTTADKPVESIIPYQIVRCVSQLDNIYETRLFGWVIAKAQSVLKLYNKDLAEINLQHAMSLTRVTLPAKMILNPDDKNYINIKKALGLANKTITYSKNGNYYHLNIIAFPVIYKSEDGRIMMTFVLHNDIWHTLLDFSKGHRTFSLPTYIKLTNKYSVIMYLLVSNQTRTMTYGVATLKSLLGCEHAKTYQARNNAFCSRVLDPAREELLAKAPYYFDYSCSQSGKNHAVTEIIIIPQVNKHYIQAEPTATMNLVDSLRCRLDDDVKRYVIERFTIKGRQLDRLEPIIASIGGKAEQLARLSQIFETAKRHRVKNYAGYAYKSIKALSKP